ncbi:putative DEP domain, glutaredoxin, Thioredoxin-like superfamily [Helianthus annuus]|nr:putative DEP domain, glutaredoxin, Thioredoxin-like superfamily [Helianthus annuus]KAJ0737661.1 putative DEP domain, glutaredoxin, Thioredoxin-like superfamily [Helianthus annuus]
MGLPNGDVHVANAVETDTHLTSQKPLHDENIKNVSNGDDYGEQNLDDSSVDDSNTSNSNSDDCSDEICGEDEEKETPLDNGEQGENTVVFPPNPQLPRPEAPPGVLVVYTEAEKTVTPPLIKRSNSSPESTVQIPAIGKFFREKSNSLSAAITKRLSLLTDEDDVSSDKRKVNSNVTEFNLSGLKVTVALKQQNNENEQFKGRITFFSRSNCRDSTAVRSYFRDRNLRYVEINVDVYPTREIELIERTGTSAVPQIFFNEKLFGGLVTLNSLRNCGLLEERMKDLLSRKCPDDAPAAPVYGFDDPEEEKMDEMVAAVRVLRQRLPIQDRLMKMKIVKNCFSAAEMVEVLIHQFDCGRKKAVEMGKQLARRHFIHHVFGENEFEDGNHFYRFLEHEPFIPNSYNFRGSTNDLEPKAATFIGQKLAKIMSAILESYASEDGCHLDYIGISNSEEFRRYVNLVQELQRADISTLSDSERLAFFINLHNAMVIHGVISVGHPGSAVINRRSFNSDFVYIIGGSPYSLTTIVNGVLRNNRRAPYSFTKPFASSDKRLELAFPQVNPLIHFGICNGSKSSPPVRFFSPHGIESELRFAAREFLQRDGIQIDLAKRTVHLTRIFKWFSADFGQEKEILKWITGYLDASKAGLLSHLSSDGGAVHIVYQDYDWSVNC